MDDRMQQCPNCGSAVLPSARFCVTCGIRLPEPASETGPAEPAIWTRPEEDVWIGEAPASGGGDVMTMPPSEDSSSTQVEPVREEQANASGEPPEAPEAGPVNGEVIALPTDDSELLSGAVSHPVEGIEDRLEVNGERVGPEGELAPAAPDIANEDTAELAGSETGDSRDDTATPDSFDMSSDDVEEPDDFEPAGWDDSDDALSGAVESESPDTSESGEGHQHATTSDSVSEPPVSGDHALAISRAETLLEELRQLLPQLARPTATEPAIDRATLHERAIAARGERSFDDFASLRDVVHDAVHRPKDIEVVLRLSQHANDIEALLDERDRLQTAFDDLLRELAT